MKNVLDHPSVYRLWQAPFVHQKLAPVVAFGFPHSARVLDVGCGPGTNAEYFNADGYLGVDLSDRYVEYARRRHPAHRFETRDVTSGVADLGEYDVILMNSLMHHLDDEESADLLSAVAGLAHRNQAVVHVLDLVLPSESRLSRRLALADRGVHPRSIDEWRLLVSAAMPISEVQPYSVGLAGVELWRMVHIAASA